MSIATLEVRSLLSQVPDGLEDLIRWLSAEGRVEELARAIAPLVVVDDQVPGRLTLLKGAIENAQNTWGIPEQAAMRSAQLMRYPCYKSFRFADQENHAKADRIFKTLANSPIVNHRVLLVRIWLALEDLQKEAQ